MTRSWSGVYQGEVSKLSNNWVENDAADRASHRQRYADGPEISLSVKSVDGTRIRVGSGQG
jgi:hypothetical protein